uniref:Alpha-tocopherol transfer protein n=1 Tax=Cacopsylla melanoneura TaxID=428564 RepID=A0A8D8ZPS5_9HEMI
MGSPTPPVDGVNYNSTLSPTPPGDGVNYNSTLSLDDWKYLLDNGKFSETDDVRTKALEEISNWLNENPQIGANPDPRNLLRFLRHSKYRLDVCKKKIENFYLLRSKVPEWFQNRDLSQPLLRDLLELGPFLPLLKKDSSKRTTIIIRATVHDPAIISQNTLMKLDNMVFDLAMERDETINIYGVNVILDLRNVRMGHLLSPATVKKAVHSWQDCYPVSPKRFDFIFVPKLIDVALSVFRRFMTAKMRARVHVHGVSLESLHAQVDPSILPIEYGGTAGPVQDLIDYWKQEVLNAKDWYLEEDKFCTVLEKPK